MSPTPGGRRIRLGYRRAWGRLRGKGAGQRAGLGRGLSVHGPLPASLFPCDKSTALSYGLPESCEARPPSQPCPVPQPLPPPLVVWAWAECTGGQGLSEPPAPLRVARLPQRPPGSSGRCWTRAILASTAAPAATGRSSALASWLCCGLGPGASHSCLPCSGQLARGQEACVDRPGCARPPQAQGCRHWRCPESSRLEALHCVSPRPEWRHQCGHDAGHQLSTRPPCQGGGRHTGHVLSLWGHLCRAKWGEAGSPGSPPGPVASMGAGASALQGTGWGQAVRSVLSSVLQGLSQAES